MSSKWFDSERQCSSCVSDEVLPWLAAALFPAGGWIRELAFSGNDKGIDQKKRQKDRKIDRQKD